MPKKQTSQLSEKRENSEKKENTEKKGSRSYNDENLNFDQHEEKNNETIEKKEDPPKEKKEIAEKKKTKTDMAFQSIQEMGSPPVEPLLASVKNLSKHDSNLSKEDKERKSTKKGTNTSLGIKVGPEIFVSLKKGSMGQYYSMGKTLGEGNDDDIVYWKVT